MKQKLNLQQLVRAALLIAIGIILPQVFHSVKDAGSILLPMHIPVLIGGFILNPYYALCVGIITPILSLLFTGMPNFPYIYVMMLELASYALFISLLYNKVKLGLYPSLIGGMIVGRIMSIIGNYFILHILMSAPFNISVVAAGLFIKGIPGIVIQIVLIPLIVYALKRNLNIMVNTNGK
ncbi:ECF transporter S component [Clostridium neuense]|uniref:ECF transporter S component n=1 Tax=Clostridium neuense TaxID=1728934 RepID=A0ABW8TA45_9CLOT